MAKETSKKKENQAPVKQFRAGQVTASIWAKKQEINKKEVTFYSVTIVKNYMDKEEEWKQTSSFNREDLIKVEIVTRKASEYIYLQEFDVDEE